MDRPSALYSAGYVCKLDGKLAAAESLFRSAIEQSPSYNAKAHTALAQVLDERAQLRKKKKVSAKPRIDRTLVDIP